MTVLPSNLAAVADDLARATLKDARRTIKRRRIVTLAIAFALLALTASAAIATGWLSEKAPTASAVPELAAGSGVAGVQVLLSGLGSQLRALSSEATPGGGICITLTGFEKQCVPTLLVKQQIAWFVRSLGDGTTVIFGIARPEVTAVEAISGDGTTTAARLGNGAFFLELNQGPATHVLVHMEDGTSFMKPISPCPPETPNCAH